MHSDFSKSGDAIERPNVKAWAWSLCQLQISVPYATFGLPKALMKRSIQRRSSEIGVPLGVLKPEAIAFGLTTPSGTPISDDLRWIERFINAFGSPNGGYGTEICNWHKDHAHGFTFGRSIAAP